MPAARLLPLRMPENPPGIEIETVQAHRTAAFWQAHERETLRTRFDFTVIWHEQRHEFAAVRAGEVVGALRLRIAASLAHIEALSVAAPSRRTGIGRRLLERAEEIANYYNCHKMTLELAERSAACAFFTTCGYRLEAVLPQHTFKLDIAVMRKFLL